MTKLKVKTLIQVLSIFLLHTVERLRIWNKKLRQLYIAKKHCSCKYIYDVNFLSEESLFSFSFMMTLDEAINKKIVKRFNSFTHFNNSSSFLFATITFIILIRFICICFKRFMFNKLLL